LNLVDHIAEYVGALTTDDVLHDLLREIDQSWIRERGSNGQADAELGIEIRDRADGLQRMATQLEEVVVTADAFDLQQLPPDSGQALFYMTLRRFEGLGAKEPSSGAGNAFRSSLPFAVSGTRSNCTYAAGTMCSGSVFCSISGNCDTSIRALSSI
jgi:hypothetical protein